MSAEKIKMSQAALMKLRLNSLTRFKALLADPEALDPVTLAYAAEYASSVITFEEACDLIMPLLSYPKGYVREGAVYGLERFLHNPVIREALEQQLLQETSPTMRQVLEDALNGDI